MKKKAFVIIGLTIFIISPFNLFAQNSNIRSDEWLKNNDRGNRYEGLYSKEIGSPFYELISFWGHYEPYEVRKKQELSIRFFSPEDIDFRLHAEEFNPQNSWYWMQAKNTKAIKGWQEFTPWPVDDRLKYYQIASNNIGVLIEFEKPGSSKILPALIFHSKRPDTIKRYVATIRLGKSISEGSFEVKSIDTNKIIDKGDIPSKYGGSYFQILLDISTFNGKTGWYELSVSLTEKERITARTFSFDFFHQEALN